LASAADGTGWIVGSGNISAATVIGRYAVIALSIVAVGIDVIGGVADIAAERRMRGGMRYRPPAAPVCRVKPRRATKVRATAVAAAAGMTAAVGTTAMAASAAMASAAVTSSAALLASGVGWR
jgi:hypothetical protein